MKTHVTGIKSEFPSTNGKNHKPASFRKVKTSLSAAAAIQAFILIFAAITAGCTQGGKNAAMNEKIIALKEAMHKGMSLEEALKQRRSIRRYSDREMTEAELAQLLFSGQGVTGSIRGLNLRTAPSAGATYPMELYAVVNNVEGLTPGIYRYLPASHSLELLDSGDFAKALSAACLGQGSVEKAAVNFVITAVPVRITGRYGERSARYVYMEAGHIGQNILLQATSLGLGGVPIGAFNDREVNRILSLEEDREITVYIIAVGTRR